MITIDELMNLRAIVGSLSFDELQTMLALEVSGGARWTIVADELIARSFTMTARERDTVSTR